MCVVVGGGCIHITVVWMAKACPATLFARAHIATPPLPPHAPTPPPRSELGDGTQIDRVSPTAVGGNLNFAQMTAANIHTCGITTAGDSYCWGGSRAEPPMPSKVHAATMRLQQAGVTPVAVDIPQEGTPMASWAMAPPPNRTCPWL